MTKFFIAQFTCYFTYWSFLTFTTRIFSLHLWNAITSVSFFRSLSPSTLYHSTNNIFFYILSSLFNSVFLKGQAPVLPLLGWGFNLRRCSVNICWKDTFEDSLKHGHTLLMVSEFMSWKNPFRIILVQRSQFSCEDIYVGC